MQNSELKSIMITQSSNLNNDIQKKISYLQSDEIFSTYKHYIDDSYFLLPTSEDDSNTLDSRGERTNLKENRKIDNKSNLEVNDKQKFANKIAMLRGLSNSQNDFKK